MVSLSPAPGVALTHRGRNVCLKWHMLRRSPGDAAHSRANLRVALERRAVAEVDLRFSADGDGVCLHDERLEAETTGAGAVGAVSKDALRRLRQRGREEEILETPPLLLEEVVAAAGPGAPARASIQLDLKAGRGDLDDRTCARFRELLGPRAGCFTLSGEDWPAVRRLARDIPQVRLGFEPLRLFRNDWPRQPAEFRILVERIIATAPEAAVVYLHAGLALRGLAAGENPIARLVEAGRVVDCWTVDPHRTEVGRTLQRLIEAGCDQITTNGPEALETVWREHLGSAR